MAAQDTDLVPAVDEGDWPLSPRELEFVQTYLTHGCDGREACVTMGYEPRFAARHASRFLASPGVRAQVRKWARDLTGQQNAEVARLVHELEAIAFANHAEVSRMVRTACGECWLGLGGPDEGPDPECPSCKGRGHVEPRFAPHEEYGHETRVAFAGVKVTRNGIEVRMHNKMAALDALAKIRGAYKADNEQKNAGLNELAQYIQANAAGLPIRRQVQGA